MSSHSHSNRAQRPTAEEVARLAEGRLEGDERDRVAAAVADHDDESHVLTEVAAFLDAEEARNRGPATVEPIRRAPSAPGRMGLRLGLAGGLAAAVLLVLLVQGPATVVADAPGALIEHADEVDRIALEGDGPSFALGSAASPARRGLLVGEDLIRWQVARAQAGADGVAGSAMVSVLASRLERRLRDLELDSAAAAWRADLAADPTASGPDAEALDALRAALPEGTVEAGRWLAVLRLWPASDVAALDRSLRSEALAALERAGLIDSSAPTDLRLLLERQTLDAADLRRLRLEAETLSRGTSS